MKYKTLILILYLCFFLISCTIRSNKKHNDQLQQIKYVSICDTSKIYLYNSEQPDTLKGKGIIRLLFQNKSCNKIKIKSGKILFLSITKKDNNTKMIEYRRVISDSLLIEDKKIVTYYEKKIYDIFKKKKICCTNKKASLISKEIDFSFTFFVFPTNSVK